MATPPPTCTSTASPTSNAPDMQPSGNAQRMRTRRSTNSPSGQVQVQDAASCASPTLVATTGAAASIVAPSAAAEATVSEDAAAEANTAASNGPRKKRYKSTLWLPPDSKLPVVEGYKRKLKNEIVPTDWTWLNEQVRKHTSSGGKPTAQFVKKMQKKLHYVDENVLRNQVNGICKRLELKKKYPAPPPSMFRKVVKDVAQQAAAKAAQASKQKLSEAVRMSELHAAESEQHKNDAARLANECERLKSDLSTRCEAIDKLKSEVGEVQMQAIQEAKEQLATREKTIEVQNAELKKLHDDLSQREASLRETTRAADALRKRIESQSFAADELKTAKAELEDLKCTQDGLVKAMFPLHGKIKELTASAQTTQNQVAEEREKAKTLEVQLQRRTAALKEAQADLEEAKKRLSVYQLCPLVEERLRKNDEALQAALLGHETLQHDARYVFTEAQSWNMENLIKLAVAVNKAGADLLSVSFLSQALHKWKKLRNDVAHKSRAVDEFLRSNDRFLDDIQRVLRTIDGGIESIKKPRSLARDKFLKDVLDNINKV